MLTFCLEAIRIESNFYLILMQKEVHYVFSLLFLYVSDDTSTIKLLWDILLALNELQWITSVAFPISGVLDRLSGLLTFQTQRIQETGKLSSRETHVRWRGG